MRTPDKHTFRINPPQQAVSYMNEYIILGHADNQDRSPSPFSIRGSIRISCINILQKYSVAKAFGVPLLRTLPEKQRSRKDTR